MASLKNSEEYKKLSQSEKANFDDKFKAREETIDGQKVIVLTFNSKEDADKFIEQLRKQGIKFTINN